MDRDAKKLTTRCPCSRDRSNEPYILKIMDISDCGVTIFRFVTGYKDVVKLSENGDLIEMNGDAIVIYNTSDVFITPERLRAAINPNSIQCPRCREYLNRAKTVINNITFLDRNGLMAICDHCIKRNKILESCVKCAVANKRFSAFRNLETKFLPSQNRKFRVSSAPTKPDLKILHDQRHKFSEQRKYSIPVKSFDSDFSVTDLGRIKSRRNNKLWKYMENARYSDEKSFSDTSLSKTNFPGTLRKDKIYSKDLDKYYSSSILPRKDKHQIHSSEFTPLSFKVSHEGDKEKPILQDGKVQTTHKSYVNDIIQEKHHELDTNDKGEHKKIQTLPSKSELDFKSKLLKRLDTGKQLENETDIVPNTPKEAFQRSNTIMEKILAAKERDKYEKNKIDKDNEKELTQKEKEINQYIKEKYTSIDNNRTLKFEQKNTEQENIHIKDIEVQKGHKEEIKLKEKTVNKENIDDFKSNKTEFQPPKQKKDMHKFDQKESGKEESFDDMGDKNKKNVKKDFEGKKVKGTDKGNADKTTETDIYDDEQKLYKKLMNVKAEKKETIDDLKSNKTGVEHAKQKKEKQKFDMKESGTEKTFKDIENVKKSIKAKKIISIDSEGQKTKGTGKEIVDESTEMDFDDDEQKLNKKLINARAEKKETIGDLKSNKVELEPSKQKKVKQKYDKIESGSEQTFRDMEYGKKNIKAKIMSIDSEGKKAKGTGYENLDKITDIDLDDDEQKLYKKLMNAKAEKKETIDDLESNKAALEPTKQKKEKQKFDKIEFGKEESFEDIKGDKNKKNAKKIMNKDFEGKKVKGTGKENADKTTETDIDDDEQKLYKKLMNAKAEKKEAVNDLKSSKAGLEPAKQKKEKQKFDMKEPGTEASFEDIEGDIKNKKIMSKDKEEKKLKRIVKENTDNTTETDLDDNEQELYKKLINAKAEKTETKDDLKSNKAGLEPGRKKKEKQKPDNKAFDIEKTVEDIGTDKNNINAKKMISKDLERKEENGIAKGYIDKSTQMDLDEDEQKLFKKLMNAKEVTERKEIVVDLKSNKAAFEQAKQTLVKQKVDKKQFSIEKPVEEIETDKKNKNAKKILSRDLEGKGGKGIDKNIQMDLDEDEQKIYKKLMNAKEVTETKEVKVELKSNKAAFEQAKQKLEKQSFDKKEFGIKKGFEDIQTDTKNLKAMKILSKDLEGKEEKGNTDKTTQMDLDEDELKLYKKLMNAKPVTETKEVKVDLKSNKAAFEQTKQKLEKQNFDKKESGIKKAFEDIQSDKKNLNAKKILSKDIEGKEEKGNTDKTTQMDLDEDELKLYKKLMNAKPVTETKEVKVDLKSNKAAFEQTKQKLEKQNFDKKESGIKKAFEDIQTDTKKFNAKKNLSKDIEGKEEKGNTDKTTQMDLDEDELKLYKKLMNAKPVTETKEVKVDLKSNKAAFEQTKQKLEKQNFDKKESGIKKAFEDIQSDKKNLNAKKILSKDIEGKEEKGNTDKTTQMDLDEDELKLYKKLMNAKPVTATKEVKVDLKLSGNKEAFEKKMQSMDKKTAIDQLLNSRKIVKKVKDCSACDSFDTESSIHMNNSESNTIILEHDICKIQKQIIREAVPQDALYFKTIIRDLADSDSLPEKEETDTQTKDSINIGKGVIRYALSDRKFIDKGWTMLPVEKVVRKMNVYRMRPARPTFDWFEHNKHKGLISYDTGEKLAEINNNGRGQWFYKNGRVALDYYDCEELHAQQRVVLYSSKEPDEYGRRLPVTILATFDYLGNGVVFDHAGKIRLKYNQTEGVVLDRTLGPVSNWKWHSLNDPPVLQQVMIDTQLPYKNPEILKLNPTGRKPNKNEEKNKNEDMLAIEFDNFIKEKAKKLTQHFKPYQIKMKALKINEHFSLRILDQATIYLLYRAGKTNLKLNLGMLLDHKEIIDTDTAEVGQVAVSAELLPAKTDSLADIQDMIDKAKRFDKSYLRRELRIHPAVTQLSIDKINACKSSRPPVRDWPNNTYIHACTNCRDKRKPTCGELYRPNTMFQTS